LANIVRGSRQATRLVNQLLALARAEAHSSGETAGSALPKTSLDLSALALDIAADRVGDALAQGHDLGLEADEAVCLQGNETLLKELIKNLIDNALTYTPSPGHITVRTATNTDDWAVLEVEDTGIGILESERAAVLQPFYRVLGTGKDGSGLGLAIVQRIVSQHQGHLYLMDNPRAASFTNAGVGLLVRIELPASENNHLHA
jgi:two-component system, OmpR family, sensor histidine kinase TctE